MATKTLISLFALFLFAAPLAHAGQKGEAVCEKSNRAGAMTTAELKEVVDAAVLVARSAAKVRTSFGTEESAIVGPVAAALILKALENRDSQEVQEALRCHTK